MSKKKSGPSGPNHRHSAPRRGTHHASRLQNVLNSFKANYAASVTIGRYIGMASACARVAHESATHASELNRRGARVGTSGAVTRRLTVEEVHILLEAGAVEGDVRAARRAYEYSRARRG